MSEKSGKLIAVWGSPHSGKTTFAASLATAIADSYASATVIVLHSDIEVPMLSVLFPNAKSGSLGSVGIPLSANAPDTEQILANCTETKARPTLAVMGYRDGDTRMTYPRYGKERATELLQRLLTLADFVKRILCISKTRNRGNLYRQCPVAVFIYQKKQRSSFDDAQRPIGL